MAVSQPSHRAVIPSVLHCVPEHSAEVLASSWDVRHAVYSDILRLGHPCGGCTVQRRCVVRDAVQHVAT